MHNLPSWQGLAVIRWQSVLVVMLAFGLVFSTATQLRVENYPIGIGEFLLLIWLFGCLFVGKFTLSPAFIALLLLSTAGMVLLGAGYILSQHPTGSMRPPALRDVLAYGFCVVLALSFTRLPEKSLYTLLYGMVCAFLLSVLLAFGLGVVASEWSGLNAWFWDVRWQNLSINPNQFALLVLPFPFIVLHLILRHQCSLPILFVLIFVFLLALTLGALSRSDALALAWMGGSLLSSMVLMRMSKASFNFNASTGILSSVGISAILISVMFLISAWNVMDGLLIDSVINFLKADLDPIYLPQSPSIPQIPSDPEVVQVGSRVMLWLNAIEVIRHSPLIGMGPGAHSGFAQPFGGVEAHNTFLDWGTQAGLLGLAALIGYVVWLSYQVARSGKHELAAMLFALYFFSMFHHILRQPIFWILPLLALGLAVSNSHKISR